MIGSMSVSEKRFAIVEDDEGARSLLLSFLAKYSQEANQPFSVKAFSNGGDLFASGLAFDVYFLDIELPGMNGLAIAQKIRSTNSLSAILFVTAIAQYAIKAYEYQARYYLVKPIVYPDFAYKLGKTLEGLAVSSPHSFSVKTTQGTYVFSSNEVKYVEVRNHTLIYHLVKETIERTGTLSAVEKELLDNGLLKCNRCFFVNPHYISRIDGYTLYLGDDSLLISRPQKKAFESAFKAWLLEGGH